MSDVSALQFDVVRAVAAWLIVVAIILLCVVAVDKS